MNVRKTGGKVKTNEAEVGKVDEFKKPSKAMNSTQEESAGRGGEGGDKCWE